MYNDQLKNDIESTLGTHFGRRLIAHILEDAGILKSIYFSGDNQTTAYMAGRQSIGIGLIELMEAAKKGSYHRLCLDIDNNINNIGDNEYERDSGGYADSSERDPDGYAV